MAVIRNAGVTNALDKHAEAREALYEFVTGVDAHLVTCSECGAELELPINREEFFENFMSLVGDFNQTLSELETEMKEVPLKDKWGDAVLKNEKGENILKFTVKQRETVKYDPQTLLDKDPAILKLPGVISRVSTTRIRKYVEDGTIPQATADLAEQRTISRSVPKAKQLKMDLAE